MRAFEKRKKENHSSNTFFDPKIQKKIKTGKAGDKYEVEADKVADKVVNNSTNTGGLMQAKEEEVQQKGISETISTVQKQETEKEEPVQKQEEEKVQQKEMKEEEPVQKKEEEQVQKKEMEKEETVQKQEEEQVQQKEMKEEEPVQKKEEEQVQAKEEEKIQQKATEEEGIQKKEKSDSESSNMESKIKKTKGEGYPMSRGIKLEMDTAFKADFSAVRIHTDSTAIALCQEMGAQAFTNGRDIYFNKGKYNPKTKAGKELLAHELTHTIQQGAIDKK